jgi:L-ascorbate metabolism protein UlaG (beta-lactamase superfamily)
MSAQHIDPGEAVMAHRILGAKKSMAIHFGTFRLADDGQEQPVLDLAEAMDADGLDRSSFWVPENGDTRRWDARSQG